MTKRSTGTSLLAGALAGLALACSGGAGSGGASSAQDALAAAAQADAAMAASHVAIGLRIAPVPLDLAGKPVGKVGLGSYIVNAQGACNNCHTQPSYAPGGDPYLGQKMVINAANYLAGGVHFGPFTSRNITPDSSGKPAGLTLEAFIQVLRTGKDSEDGKLLQVMPWPVYGQMSDHDLEAIWWYLSAIPHAEPGEAPAPAP
jgi:hypothetical protein